MEKIHEQKANLLLKIKEQVSEKGVLHNEDYKQFLELGIPFAHEKFSDYLNTQPEKLNDYISQGLVSASAFLFFLKEKLYVTRYELMNKEHFELMKP